MDFIKKTSWTLIIVLGVIGVLGYFLVTSFVSQEWIEVPFGILTVIAGGLALGKWGSSG